MAKYDIEKCVKTHSNLWETELQKENVDCSFEEMFELCISLNLEDFLRICEVNEEENVGLRIAKREGGWWYINIWINEEYKGDYLVDIDGLENFLNNIFIKRNVYELVEFG